MKNKIGDTFKNLNTDAIGKAGEVLGKAGGKAGETLGKFGSNFDLNTDADAEEVKTITGKFLGGENTRIGTKIVKFAKFFEIVSVIDIILGILAMVLGLIATVFNVIVGEFWAVGICLIIVAAGLLVIFIAFFSIATIWALYGFGQVVNDVQSIRKNTEGGFAASGQVVTNPDDLPEL